MPRSRSGAFTGNNGDWHRLLALVDTPATYPLTLGDVVLDREAVPAG